MKFIQWMNHLLQDNASTSSKKKSQIMPYLRLSVAFLCILLCALSRNAFFVVMVFAVEFLRLSFKPAEEIGKILKKMVLPVIFTGILLLPAVFMGTPKTMLTVTLKVAGRTRPDKREPPHPAMPPDPARQRASVRHVWLLAVCRNRAWGNRVRVVHTPPCLQGFDRR